ncbi:DUF742 domain-containing protein [Streptomyces sp. NPDC055036]
MSPRPEGRRRMVPGYVGLSGLAVPDNVGLERTTLLYRSPQPAADGLEAGARRLLALVEEERVLSVYECASGLGLPYGVVRMMTASLISLGLLEARPPAPIADLPDAALLEVLLDGLRAL